MKREHLLLKVAYQLLQKQKNSCYVLNLLEESTVWDEVRCDGYCLMEEIEVLLLDEGINPDELEELAEGEDDE